MLSKFRTALYPVWFVKRLNLCHCVYNRDLLCSYPPSNNGQNLFSGTFSISSWIHLLNNFHLGALWRTMKRGTIRGKHLLWHYWEFILPHSFLDVNLRGRLADLIILAKRERSSFSSTILSLATTRRVFSVLFHVRSLRFFLIGNQMLYLLDWILSFTKLPYNPFPIALWWHISLFTFLDMTTFVARLKRSELSSKNEFLKPRVASQQ